MEIIKNFTFAEMIRTSTGLDNYPQTWDELENIMLTATKLQVIREAFGSPIKVNCCYRSKAVNAKVGGVATSAHLKGLAADICASSEALNRKLYEVCKEMLGDLGIDQLIMYNRVAGNVGSPIRFIHVGFCSGTPRYQLLYK